MFLISLTYPMDPGSGVWEVYAAKVGQNLDIVVTLPRNGSIVLVKTLSDGTVITLETYKDRRILKIKIFHNELLSL